MRILYGKKEPAVSPVIATILMVAITVVLAATVYLMVSGYMTGPSKPTLYASLTETQPITNTSKATLSLSLSSPSSIPILNLKFSIGGYGGLSIPSTSAGSGASTSWSAYYTSTSNTWTGGTSTTLPTITITWTSLTGSTTTVYSGDQFVITLTHAGTSAPTNVLTSVIIQMSTTVASGSSNLVTLV